MMSRGDVVVVPVTMRSSNASISNSKAYKTPYLWDLGSFCAGGLSVSSDESNEVVSCFRRSVAMVVVKDESM